MNDSQLRDIYTRTLTSRTRARVGCPSPDAIEALVARRGSEESRLATLDHVMSCVPCKQEFELLRAIHAADRVNAESGAAAGTGTTGVSRRSVPVWIGAAAVVLIAVGGLTIALSQLRTGSNPMRGSSSTDIALVGSSNGALVWHSLADAVHYDVEIVDASGATIFTARVADTTATLPASLPTGSLSWWVRATLRDGTEHRSAIVPLPR